MKFVTLRVGVVVFACAALASAAFLPTTTQAVCNAASLSHVSYGQQGSAVTTLQQCLIDAGYSIPAGATGYYGAQTRSAVQAFYAAELGLTDWAGDSVGPQGRARLGSSAGQQSTNTTPTPQVSVNTTCSADRMTGASYGAQGEPVRALQQCLIDAGYGIPAGATGYYGAQTRTAVQQFYSRTLNIPTWHGNSVGPLGRSKLAQQGSSTPTPQPVVGDGYKRVSSATELAKYVNEQRGYGKARAMNAVTSVDMDFADAEMAMPTAAGASMDADDAGAAPERVSETNVQVSGIDEPDIVKTDGEQLYVSTRSYWYGGWRGAPETMIDIVDADVAATSMPVQEKRNTSILDAFPVSDLEVLSQAIPETGEMLLVEALDTLIVFSHPDIVAYDVSAPAEPEEAWRLALEDNTSLLTARLHEGEIYLITETYLDRSTPCPIVPIVRAGTERITVPCTDIYVPQRIEPVSHTYTVMDVDPSDGGIEDRVSFAGEQGNTVVSMFPNNIYVATRATAAQYEVLADLMIEVMTPHLSSDVIAHAKRIQGYDISDTGKLSEIEKVLQAALERLGADEQLRIENEAAQVYQEELQQRVRDMYQTRIARVAVDTLSVEAVGQVPGYLLNQFAMDEYDGYLRAAVTIDDGWGGADSVNDVYVLNMEIETVGAVQDLGLTERIYAARFIGDTGYLVTFRQIDPFYVLDLRNPNEPKMTGELKIPGYSAYLEPLTTDLVLGVGREGSGVKLSVFDVSDPTKPVEKSKYLLNDTWTEVESNHRAFLRDARHEVFFIPGGDGGYIFSYEDGELSLEKAVAGYNVQRALYIDDNMYIVTDNEVRVFDESTWEEVNSVSL